MRDRWNVPHITGKTRADVAWGAGWVTIEDRYLLIGLARNATALAALDVPGLDPFGVALSGQRFEPSRQTERFLARQTGVLRRQGRRDASFSATSTATSPAATPTTAPPTVPTSRSPATTCTRSTRSPAGSSAAAAATRRARSMFLDGLRDRLGARRGLSVWNDLRERLDPEAPTTIDKPFPYQNGPSAAAVGNRVLDAGSFSHGSPRRPPTPARGPR